MSGALDALVARRLALVARAADQRLALAAAAATVIPAGAAGQTVASLRQLVVRHPLGAALVAASAAMLVARRRRAALWLGRGWMAWRAWQAIRSWIKPAR